MALALGLGPWIPGTWLLLRITCKVSTNYQHLSSTQAFKKIYLRGREIKTDENVSSHILVFTPDAPSSRASAMARARNGELSLGLPTLEAGSQLLETSPLPPRMQISRNLESGTGAGN